MDPDGVWFSFSHYSTRTDKNGFQRQFKVYKADKEQEDSRLNELARTPKGKLRTTSVNYNWEYFKQQVKENLESETGKRIYAQRKIDVETVFGRMKGHFGMRRVHVRGKQAVHNDIGLMLMAMNLTKLMLELGRWTAQFSHHSTKKETQQILSQKKAGFCCVSFYLELVISQSLSLFFDCGAKLLNVPQIFDNFDPAGCQIVESFSAFDNFGPIWCQTVESTSPIRQLWPPR